MPSEIKMPSLGQTTEELRIVTWHKAVGDTVSLGDVLLEVETDKATIEVEAYVSGTLLEVLHTEEEVVEAGSILCYIGTPGEMLPSLSTEKKVESIPTTSLRDYSQAQFLALGKPLASPATRFLAKSQGVNLHQIQGSGPEGRIEKQDVLAWSGQNLREDNAQVPAYHDTPVPRHRQAIANQLTLSVQTIPQITLTRAANMQATRSFLATQRAAGLSGLTYTHLILRAVAHALESHPNLNRLWLSTGPSYRNLAHTHVGLAVAGENSLQIVTLSEPEKVSLEDFVRQTEQAVRRGRQNTLSAQDRTPTAITVSNLGMWDIEAFQGIIPLEQSAILAVGKVTEEVVVVQGGIHILPQMRLSLTVDHRIADGVNAAQFLKTLCDSLETPG